MVTLVVLRPLQELALSDEHVPSVLSQEDVCLPAGVEGLGGSPPSKLPVGLVEEVIAERLALHGRRRQGSFHDLDHVERLRAHARSVRRR